MSEGAPKSLPIVTTSGRSPDLRALVSDGVENRPGVYRFTGPRGEVLYVGKSVRLRSRLLAWLRPTGTGRGESKRAELTRLAWGIEWEYVPNEFEALLRELRLIRGFRPRFNVRHRKERPFAWIRLSGGRAPRLVATRSPAAGARGLLGPFPAGRDLPEVLRDLAFATGVRDCPDTTPMHFSDQLDLLGAGIQVEPACIRGDLGSCPAPCAGRCSAETYRKGVDEAIAFLEGRTEAPLERLLARMTEASAAREFERAAHWRDRTEGIRSLRARVRAFEEDRGRLNFAYRPSEPGGVEGRWGYLIVRGQVRTRFPWPDGPDPEVSAAITRSPPAPASSLSLGEREELFLVARWFRQNPGELEKTEPLGALAPPTTLPRALE